MPWKETPPKTPREPREQDVPNGVIIDYLKVDLATYVVIAKRQQNEIEDLKRENAALKKRLRSPLREAAFRLFTGLAHLTAPRDAAKQ